MDVSLCGRRFCKTDYLVHQTSTGQQELQEILHCKISQQRPQLQVADRQSCFSHIWAAPILTGFSSNFFSQFPVSKQVINPFQGYASLFQYPNSKAALFTIFVSCRTESAAPSPVSSGLICLQQLPGRWLLCTNERSNHVSLKAV